MTSMPASDGLIAGWHVIRAKGHHGYPQPENGGWETVYDRFCLRCGRHGRQIAPWRVRGQQVAGHSHFLQLNWLFDEFLVLPNVGARLVAALSGVALRPVLDHKSGRAIDDRQQLLIETVESCVEVSQLEVVTCRPDNEESAYEGFGGGEKRYAPDTPFCGSVKHHPPHVVALTRTLTSNADLVQSAEWFGSGGVSFSLTLASKRFVHLVRAERWRGLGFEPVLTTGNSLRHGL